MLGDRSDDLLMLVCSLGPVTRCARRARLIRVYHNVSQGAARKPLIFEKKNRII